MLGKGSSDLGGSIKDLSSCLCLAEHLGQRTIAGTTSVHIRGFMVVSAMPPMEELFL